MWPAYDNTKFLPHMLTMVTVFALAWRPGSRGDVSTEPEDLVAA
jgi:hypothetical protein